MIYLPEIKSCFIHVPKTGGSSMNKAFIPARPGGINTAPFSQDQHGSLGDLILKGGKEHASPEWFTWAVVRNPWDWVFSHWRYYQEPRNHTLAVAHKMSKGIPFHKWVQGLRRDRRRAVMIKRPQVDYIEEGVWGTRVSQVIPFEELPRQWTFLRSQILQRWREFKGVELHLPFLYPKENVSGPPGEWLEAYREHPEIQDIVEELYPRDCAELGYSRPFP